MHHWFTMEKSLQTGEDPKSLLYGQHITLITELLTNAFNIRPCFSLAVRSHPVLSHHTPSEQAINEKFQGFLKDEVYSRVASLMEIYHNAAANNTLALSNNQETTSSIHERAIGALHHTIYYYQTQCLSNRPNQINPNQITTKTFDSILVLSFISECERRYEFNQELLKMEEFLILPEQDIHRIREMTLNDMWQSLISTLDRWSEEFLVNEEFLSMPQTIPGVSMTEPLDEEFKDNDYDTEPEDVIMKGEEFIGYIGFGKFLLLGALTILSNFLGPKEPLLNSFNDSLKLPDTPFRLPTAILEKLDYYNDSESRLDSDDFDDSDESDRVTPPTKPLTQAEKHFQKQQEAMAIHIKFRQLLHVRFNELDNLRQHAVLASDDPLYEVSQQANDAIKQRFEEICEFLETYHNQGCSSKHKGETFQSYTLSLAEYLSKQKNKNLSFKEALERASHHYGQQATDLFETLLRDLRDLIAAHTLSMQELYGLPFYQGSLYRKIFFCPNRCTAFTYNPKLEYTKKWIEPQVTKPHCPHCDSSFSDKCYFWYFSIREDIRLAFQKTSLRKVMSKTFILGNTSKDEYNSFYTGELYKTLVKIPRTTENETGNKMWVFFVISSTFII